VIHENYGIRKEFKMEMMYNGTLVMPNNYAVVNEEEMTYVEGGGTFYIQIGKKSPIITALGVAANIKTRAAVLAKLEAMGVAIAGAIEVGTAGLGSLYAGAFILSWSSVASTIAGMVVEKGINAIKGKKFKIVSGFFIPSFTFKF
jgi:hypothetical protein